MYDLIFSSSSFLFAQFPNTPIWNLSLFYSEELLADNKRSYICTRLIGACCSVHEQNEKKIEEPNGSTSDYRKVILSRVRILWVPILRPPRATNNRKKIAFHSSPVWAWGQGFWFWLHVRLSIAIYQVLFLGIKVREPVGGDGDDRCHSTNMTIMLGFFFYLPHSQD